MKPSVPSRDGRRKKRPGPAEQKNNILNAAVLLFNQQGTKGVSISQICQRADITRPTFYRCFKDKDSLLSELYQTSVNRAVEEVFLHRFKEPKKDLSWIKGSLEEVYDAIFEYPDLADLLFRESGDPSSPAHAVINTAFDNIAKALVKNARRETNKAVSRIYLKSVMAAYQWIAHDAIKKGLSDKAKREAKEAGWMLASRVFSDQ